LRSDLTTGGPIVRLGTKCPSIMSTWTTLAPPSPAARTCSPRREKSAERIDGASSIKRSLLKLFLSKPGLSQEKLPGQILTRGKAFPGARLRVANGGGWPRRHPVRFYAAGASGACLEKSFRIWATSSATLCVMRSRRPVRPCRPWRNVSGRRAPSPASSHLIAGYLLRLIVHKLVQPRLAVRGKLIFGLLHTAHAPSDGSVWTWRPAFSASCRGNEPPGNIVQHLIWGGRSEAVCARPFRPKPTQKDSGCLEAIHNHSHKLVPAYRIYPR